MSDTLPPDMAGKGKRVAGVFLFMIGASMILDTHIMWIGLPGLAVGAAFFAWGMAEARAQDAIAAAPSSTTTEVHP